MKYRFRVVEYYPPKLNLDAKEETIEANSIDDIFKISFLKQWESSSNQYNGFETWYFREEDNPIEIFAFMKNNKKMKAATVYCEDL